MFKFSQVATLEKNKLSTDAPFLLMIEITATQLEDKIYLTRNTEDIVWRGHTWQAYPVEIDSYEEDGKTLPSLDLKVSAAGGLLVTYLQQYDGIVDAKVNIYIINAKLLDVDEAEMELAFCIGATSYDEEWVTFTLGASPEIADRFPKDRYLTDYCPFVCGDIRCGYTGSETCKNNLESCLIQERFGGEPGMTTGR